MASSSAAAPVASLRPRLQSIDMLRGGVMIVMALDHVRDFFSNQAAAFSPTDLTKTSAAIFLTRWITHFCLPVFMFCAGLGIYFWRQRGRTSAQLSKFLLTRGVWFIFLELTVMQFAYNFNLSGKNLVFLLILWIFGLCMLVMAALIHLPLRLLAVLSLAIILLHNLLDGVQAQSFGGAAWAYQLLHQPGLITFSGKPLIVTYTLFPWIGVMGAGFCFGRLYALDPAARRKIMTYIGCGAILAFLVLRLMNHYGDPAPWSLQKNPGFTVLSFLNCTKYPGSLDFILMTLGPAILLLAALERLQASARNPLLVFGRVPMFYFILHFYLIHLVVVIISYVRYGAAASRFAFHPVPSMGGPADLYPQGFGFSLPVVYLFWIAIVVALYPACLWFAGIKARRRDWWLSFL